MHQETDFIMTHRYLPVGFKEPLAPEKQATGSFKSFRQPNRWVREARTSSLPIAEPANYISEMSGLARFIDPKNATVN
jgi:hypothetical protein